MKQCVLTFGKSSQKKIVWLGGRREGASSFYQPKCRYFISSLCTRCVTNYSILAPDVKAFQQSKTESLKTEEEAKFHQELVCLFLYYQVILGRPPGACSQCSLFKTLWTLTDVNILLGLWDICFEKVYVFFVVTHCYKREV